MIMSRLRLPIALVGTFFVLAFAVHHTAFTAPPQYDSAGLLKDNEYLFHAGLAQAINIFPQRPVAMMSFYVNYLAAGIDLYYFRLVNALLLACAAGTVVLLLKLILEIPGITQHGKRNQRLLVSICLGSIFLLHPTTIYVVIYAWQRSALLSGLFSFLALAAYLATRTGRINNALAGYTVCAIMFFVAAGCKENAIALPAILLLVELAFFNASLPALLKRSVVIGGVALIAVLALSFVERPHGHIVSHGGILGTIARYYSEGGLTLAQVAMGQCLVLFEYLKMVVYPLPSNVHLVSAQIVPSSIADPPATAAAILGVVVAWLAGIFLLRRRPLVGFGTLFFLVTLLPEALLVPQYLFFGYRVFVPMFGLLLIAADVIWSLINLPQSRIGQLSIKASLISVLVAGALLMGYSTVCKEGLWMDPLALWKDAYDRLPQDDNRVEKSIKIQTLNNLGYHLAASGDLDRAIALHREAMQVDRRIAYTYICLGAAYAKMGQLDDAATTYRELLRVAKNNAYAHAGLAEVLRKQNKLEQALEHFKKAEELKPGHPDYNYGMATVWLMKNEYAAAMPYLQRTIKVNPNHVHAHYNIGKILMDSGKIDDAIDHFNKALASDGTFWMAHNNLGTIFARMGRLPQAIDHFREALQINPDDVATQKNLTTAVAALNARGSR